MIPGTAAIFVLSLPVTTEVFIFVPSLMETEGTV